MVVSELPNRLPVGPPRQAALFVALDAAFETRWAAWIARSRVHEQRARRKFVVGAGVFAVAVAISYALLH